MLTILKRFFNKTETGIADASEPTAGHDVRIAACALFLEMARIDGSFSEEETEKILSILKEQYDLSGENAEALIQSAEQELNESVDLWQFARLINENYSTEEKMEIITMLWKIVYVDGKLDKYEDYLMHKLEQLLRISHRQLIEAKLAVLHPPE